MRRAFFYFLITLGFPALIFAQDGQALYRAHCASCHEASAQTRAPSRDAFRGLTPERILDGLEAQSGVMLIQEHTRTSAERRALAVYLSAKSFGTEKQPDLNQAACKQSTGFRDPLSGPNWNGWSAGPSNVRFQDSNAAGIDINRVPQVKLKWSFAYPGDVMAYAQATVVGGRVFVGSSGHRVYSLDAASGSALFQTQIPKRGGNLFGRPDYDVAPDGRFLSTRGKNGLKLWRQCDARRMIRCAE
jgi:polyvinyl alcohol dehydrogenase (cytochrome)